MLDKVAKSIGSSCGVIDPQSHIKVILGYRDYVSISAVRDPPCPDILTMLRNPPRSRTPGG